MSAQVEFMDYNEEEKRLTVMVHSLYNSKDESQTEEVKTDTHKLWFETSKATDGLKVTLKHLETMKNLKHVSISCSLVSQSGIKS